MTEVTGTRVVVSLCWFQAWVGGARVVVVVVTYYCFQMCSLMHSFEFGSIHTVVFLFYEKGGIFFEESIFAVV